MSVQQIYVLGSDGNLWLEDGPFGEQIPPPRTPVDGDVDLYASFWPFDAQATLVCGDDGNLWLEQGPFNAVPLPDSSYPPGPGTRCQIDGSVGAYAPLDEGDIFVCGQDGNLWYEFGFGTTNPAVPPPRYPVDGDVAGFQPISAKEVYVLGSDGNLWHEFAPFGAVPPPTCTAGATTGCRTLVDINVREFMAVDSQHVFVVDAQNNLWLDAGSFPPGKVQVDGDVAGIWAVDAETVFVLGLDGNLWLETAPFGVVPLPLCSQTSGFGQGFACRTLVASSVDAFGFFPDAGGVFVIDFNLDLFQVSPRTQIDGNVIDFYPLSPGQSLMGERRHARPALRMVRPTRPIGLGRSRLPRRG
jgi:hypothetical protein